MLEQIRLPFWYDGPQYDLLEAGFGPYALSRLARASGGIYFVTRFTGRRMGFDPGRMREYRARLDQARPVRESGADLALAASRHQRRADHSGAEAAGNADPLLSTRR